MQVGRAILDAAQSPSAMASLSRYTPSCLLPLLDRPFLQHVIEYLVQSGVQRVDVILDEHAELIESALQDGTRWGIQIVYHLAPDPEHVFSALAGMEVTAKERILVAEASRFPAEPLLTEDESESCAFLDGDEGWFWVRGEELRRKDETVGSFLQQVKKEQARKVDAWYRMTSPGDMLEAMRFAMETECRGLRVSGRLQGDRVWMGRNVVIHPTAQIHPPVFLGPNSRLSAGVSVGPDVAVQGGVLIDTQSQVQRSIVLENSYVGEKLELSDAIVDRNRMVNTRLGGVLEVEDDFILGSMETSGLRLGSRWAAQWVVAWFLLIPSLLVHLFCFLFRKTPAEDSLREVPYVRAPFGENPGRSRTLMLRCHHTPDHWKSCREHFVHFVSVNIGQVIRGRVWLVGFPLREREEAEQMDHARLKLYAQNPGGLIDEARVVHGADAPEDLIYASEAVYSVTKSIRYDLMLLMTYFHYVLFPGKENARLSRVEERA